MKTSILFLFVLTILSSCSPTKKIERIYSQHPELRPRDSIQIKTEYKEKISYRDTFVYIKLPPDTVTGEAEIIIISPNTPTITPRILSLETQLAQAKAWIEGSKLKMELTDKDTTLEIRLKNALRNSEYWYTRWEKETKIIPEIRVPKFWKITGSIGMGFLLAFIVWLVMKLKKIVKI